MAIDYISLGARIRYYRTQSGLTQEELADEANISRSLIGFIERGDKAPSMDSFINIANALRVPADELLVDNLTVSNSQRDGDDYYILLDCSPEEATILVRNMKDLKEILRKYTIK